MTRALPFLLCLALAACASPPSGGKGGAFCDVESPPVLTESTIAAMSRDELKVAVERLEFGEKVCGWRPIR